MSPGTVRLFLGGDFMPARGVDQILPHPGDPRLHEAYAKDARDYYTLAERRNGPIPRPVGFDYCWGVVPQELARQQPAVRLVNLETAVTRGGMPEPKGINYRLNPDNLPLLTAGGLDGCVLANNHVLDWGESGLLDTLAGLDGLGIARAGAGRDLDEALAPAALPLPDGGRLLIFSRATGDSGVPWHWGAEANKPGVALLNDLGPDTVRELAAQIRAHRQPGDRVLLSIHWGGNWAFGVPPEQRRFAHAVVDQAGVDLVHGHSSHHVRAIEVYRERLILYGCGDLLDDYEGIEGYEAYRSDLGLLYFPELDAQGALCALRLFPTRLRRLRIEAADLGDRTWLRDTLDREGRPLGTRVTETSAGDWRLAW